MLKTLFSKMTIQDTASLMQSSSRSDDDIDRIIAPKIGACRAEIIEWIGDSENLGDCAMRLPSDDVKKVLSEKLGEVTVSQDDTFDDNIAIRVDSLIKKIVEEHKDDLAELYNEQNIRDGYSSVDSVEKLLSIAVTKFLKILCEEQLSEIDFGKQVYSWMKHHIAVFIKLNDFLLSDGRRGLQNMMGASGLPDMFQSQLFSFLERVGNSDITQDDWTCFITKKAIEKSTETPRKLDEVSTQEEDYETASSQNEIETSSSKRKLRNQDSQNELSAPSDEDKSWEQQVPKEWVQTIRDDMTKLKRKKQE